MVRPMLMLLSVCSRWAQQQLAAVQRQREVESKAAFPLLPQQAVKAETEYCSPEVAWRKELTIWQGKFAKRLMSGVMSPEALCEHYTGQSDRAELKPDNKGEN
ncbi:hypothetical protein KCP73_19620 [Salmonella enterica subsp. enterica]|nr:hypothetical protein KCP73_19620 [Salmonella enterica subsp. enterica]